jgi:small subunit ribosomal protein S17
MPKRILTGTVVSDKGEKTVVVRVDRRVKHPLYGKIIKLSKKYHAHDEDNSYAAGEQVRIQECAPISKLKTWTVIERLGAAKAAPVEIVEGATDKPVETSEDKPKAKAAKPAAKATTKKAKAKDAEPADA